MRKKLSRSPVAPLKRLARDDALSVHSAMRISVILIFIGLFANASQAEEEIFYPSSIKKLQKEIKGDGENSLSSEHLRKLCHQEYLNIANSITPEERINTGEITIFNNGNLTKEERKFLGSNWSGSIIFSDQELESIKTITDE